MTTPAPQLPFDVRAVTSYTARNAGEVSIEAGRVYSIIQIDPRQKWYKTRRPDAPGTGWIPATYVRSVTPPPSPAPHSAAPSSAAASPAAAPVPASVQELPPLPVFPDGTVDVDRVPAAWKELFKAAGIRKKDLLDAAFTARVYDILGLPNPDAQAQPQPQSQSAQQQQSISVPVQKIQNVPRRRLTADLLERILNPAVPADLPSPRERETDSPYASMVKQQQPPPTQPSQQSQSNPQYGQNSASYSHSQYGVSPSPASSSSAYQHYHHHHQQQQPHSNPQQYQQQQYPQQQYQQPPPVSMQPSHSPYQPTLSSYPPPQQHHPPPQRAPVPELRFSAGNGIGTGIGGLGPPLMPMPPLGKNPVSPPRSPRQPPLTGNSAPPVVPASASSSSAPPVRPTLLKTPAPSGSAHVTPLPALPPALTPSSRFVLSADPLEFDRGDHPWRSPSLSIYDVVIDNPMSPKKSQSLFAQVSGLVGGKSGANDAGERQRWLALELTAHLSDSSLAARPVAQRLALVRATLSLLGTALLGVDEAAAAPLRRHCRDQQTKAGESVAQDARQTLHDLKSTQQALLFLETDGDVPAPIVAALETDHSLKVNVYIDQFKQWAQQGAGQTGRVKLAYVKEWVPQLKVLLNSDRDLIRPILRDVAHDLRPLAIEVQRSMGEAVSRLQRRLAASLSALGPLQPLLRVCGSKSQSQSASSASASPPWPSQYPVSLPLLSTPDPAGAQLAVVHTRGSLKLVLDVYADYVAQLDAQLIAWRLAHKMLDLLLTLLPDEPQPASLKMAPLPSSSSQPHPPPTPLPVAVTGNSAAATGAPRLPVVAKPAALPSSSSSPAPSSSVAVASSGAKKVCTHCGFEQTRAQAKFCGSCGQSLEEEPRLCKECGAECTPQEKFCWQCGASVPVAVAAVAAGVGASASSAQQQQTTPKPVKPLPKPVPKTPSPAAASAHEGGHDRYYGGGSARAAEEGAGGAASSSHLLDAGGTTYGDPLLAHEQHEGYQIDEDYQQRVRSVSQAGHDQGTDVGAVAVAVMGEQTLMQGLEELDTLRHQLNQH